MGNRSEAFRRLLARRLFSTLGGVTIDRLKSLLDENGWRIDAAGWPRCLALFGSAAWNTLLAAWEEDLHGAAIRATDVAPPLFILGHWRSGTTHLHNLLAQDSRFGFPTLYACLYPHHFLSSERWLGRLWANAVPRKRLIDNMSARFWVPFEDEFAVATMTGLSPYLGWAFPEREDHYERYLSFEGVAAEDVDRWKAALLLFVRKVALRSQKPLVLKSPPHTARVRLLLDLFPDARFVHIRRDPFEVFPSTRHMVSVAYTLSNFHAFDLRGLDERVFRRYRVLEERYRADRALIPSGRLHELTYEELVRDPIGALDRLYAALGLGDLSPALPVLDKYLAKQGEYRRNEYPPLDSATRERVKREWGGDEVGGPRLYGATKSCL